MSDPRFIPLRGGKYDGKRVYDHGLDICEDDGIRVVSGSPVMPHTERYVVVPTSSANHVEGRHIPSDRRVQGAVWRFNPEDLQ